MLQASLALLGFSQSTDWLIHPYTTPTTLETTADGFTLTNGLIARTFVARAGAFCTIDLMHLKTTRSYFRAITVEANLTLGTADAASHGFSVGGCVGQPDNHYEFFDADAWQANLTANASHFQMRNHSTAPPAPLYPWKPANGAPTNMAWPPQGLTLTVDFIPPVDAPVAVAGIVVSVHYEMYDGLPAIRKWVTVSNTAAAADTAPIGATAATSGVVVETLHYEFLKTPNWAPEHITILGTSTANQPYSQQLQPDPATNNYFSNKQALWHTDPEYDQHEDRNLHIPFSGYTFLVVGYMYDKGYGGPTGPGARLQPGEAFVSLSTRMVLHDSTLLERQSLTLVEVQRRLSPALTESPILAMVTDASSSAALRHALDQLAATGHELAIIGFGAKGWCGMCDSQLTNETFRQWLTGEVAYAKTKGLLLSGYTLMQHNDWGMSTPVAEQTLNRDGTRGPTACFATDFHADYRNKVLAFLAATGLGGIETDGQFEGLACADESHDHHHNGLAGGWSAQLETTLRFNQAVKALGVYQTGADAYFWSGAQRTNFADTDGGYHLNPLWEAMTLGRMYVYDNTIARLAPSGEYSVDDLFARTADGCGEGRGPRARCIDFIHGGFWLLAGQPYFHAAELYDEASPDATAVRDTIAKWSRFAKSHRDPRPSGAPGVLYSFTMHLLRPNARGLEAVVHVTADTSLPLRALVGVLNPTDRAIKHRLVVPLYYTGLAPGSRVTVASLATSSGDGSAAARMPLGGSANETHTLGADEDAGFTEIVLTVTVEAASYAVFGVSV